MPKDVTGVETFLQALEHPLKKEIETIRSLVLAADPRVRESIKWNAPSFLITEHFATFNFGPKRDRLQLILHSGAKPRPSAARLKIDDPSGLIKWLAPDRGIVIFADEKDAQEKMAALASVIQQWIKAVA